MPSVVVILASHNRRDKTVASLHAVFGQVARNQPSVEAVLFDDGSIDGTAATVRALFPSVLVIEGDGNSYWAGGMACAERAALGRTPDYVLWLNDDVVLVPTALDTLLDTANANPSAIIVGAVSDPESGQVTYSALRRSWWHPLRMTRVDPDPTAPLRGDTFNGNVVLVPRCVNERIGGIDGHFVHALADLDFGLRASSAQVPVLLAPGSLGYCARTSSADGWRDAALPARTRLARMLDPKGFPPRPALRFLRRHGGLLWPLFFVVPYVRLGASAIRGATGGNQRVLKGRKWAE